MEQEVNNVSDPDITLEDTEDPRQQIGFTSKRPREDCGDNQRLHKRRKVENSSGEVKEQDCATLIRTEFQSQNFALPTQEVPTNLVNNAGQDEKPFSSQTLETALNTLKNIFAENNVKLSQ